MSLDIPLPARVSEDCTTLELSPGEQSQAQKLAEQLQSGSLQAIHSFGREIGTHASIYADSLLEQVKPKDLDLIGGRLTNIVVAAQALNLHSLSDKRSKIPLIGGLIDRMRLRGADIANQFQSVREQVDQLVTEVQEMQSGLAQRVDALDQAFESIKQEYRLLGVHIEAGETVTRNLQQRLSMTVSTEPDIDALKAQELHDLQSAAVALEKRVADLRLLQHSAVQQLPMIRMVQTNNRMLIEKFYTIKELTVPAWKRQFTLTLSLAEQKNAVQLANTIDDATNDFLKANARLLKDNTLSTARANQRLVIDVTTLQEVHDTLISTVQEVAQINQEGIRQRDTVSTQLQTLRQQLAQRLGSA